MVAKREYYERRLEALKRERSSWISHWRELGEYVMPRTTRLSVTDANNGASKKATKVHDSTATYSAQTLSSGMMAGLTNPARPWFNLRASKPDLNKSQAVKRYLDDVRTIVAETFVKSNLYTVLPSIYLDLGVFGTSAALVEPHPKRTLNVTHFPVGSYMLGVAHDGSVDAFYREFRATAHQLVTWFGKENCSQAVNHANENDNKDAWFDVVHVIEANDDFDEDKLEAKFKRFVSVYFEKNTKDNVFLEVGGYDEWPLITPRWTVCGEDTYGTSPGMMALPDVKGLQVEQKGKLNAINKGINPPVNAPTSLQNEAISLLAGGINFANRAQGQEGITPLYQINPGWLPALTADIQETQYRIRRAFHEDLFLLIANDTRSNITAQEIIARQEEKMLILGPVLTRLVDELNDPLIERTVAILARAGKLPDPPPELEGEDLAVEYVSTMAQAMKMTGVSNLEHLVQFAGSLATAWPEVLDAIDSDEVVSSMADMLGTPAKVVRDRQVVQRIRDQKAQESQAMQSMQMAQQGATAAKTLADTQVTDPSLLQQMLGATGGLG